jgi:hypothetical protein
MCPDKRCSSYHGNLIGKCEKAIKYREKQFRFDLYDLITEWTNLVM